MVVLAIGLFTAAWHFKIFSGVHEVFLKVLPTSRQDLFRGDYLALEYDISRIDPDKFKIGDLADNPDALQVGQAIYVHLEVKNKIAAATVYGTVKPLQGLFIRGECQRRSDTDNTKILVFGIERCFMPSIDINDPRFRRGDLVKDLLVKVKIDDDGRATIAGIFFNGEDLLKESSSAKAPADKLFVFERL
jgi:uncharacterized membrane-anchored protein